MSGPKSPIPPEPWKPQAWEPEDAWALRALQSGTATAGQQQRALDWIISAARTYDLPYSPTNPHDTAFACGMQHVGKQIVKLLNVKLERANTKP